MPKFLVEATYSAEGFQGLAQEKASGRKAAVTQAIKKEEGWYVATDRPGLKSGQRLQEPVHIR